MTLFLSYYFPPESSFDVVPNTSLDSKRNPIFIGANNRVLSCIKSGDGQLQLKLMVSISFVLNSFS